MKPKDDTVDLSRLHPDLVEVLPLVETIYRQTLVECGLEEREPVATSGAEGSPAHGPHGVKSKHYPANNASGMGEAIDIRLNDLQSTTGTEVAGQIARHLRIHHPGRFRVFHEGCLSPNAHVHIQVNR